ncbi:MAG: PAS domain-containing protein [Anaerolineales bacterium]
MDKITLEILLVEDSLSDSHLLQEALLQDVLADFNLTVVESLTTALETLSQQTFNAVLLNLNLPDSKGLNAFLKLQHSAPELPLVVLSALDDEEVAIQSMQAGAQDYLIKRPEDFRIAGRVLRYAIERNRAEIVHRRSEELLAEAQRVGQIGHWEWKAPGRLMYGSKEFFRILEVEPEGDTIPQMRIMEMMDKQDVERLQKLDYVTFAEKGNLDYEYRIHLSNGGERWLHQIAKVTYDDHGKPVRMVGTIQDITERKQAEEKLRESEERHRRAMEAAGVVPYYEVYYDGATKVKYEFIGEGIRQITGYGPEEFSAAIWETLVDEAIPVEELAGYSLDEAIEKVRSGEIPTWKCEFKIRSRNGSLRWVYETAVELRDVNGNIIGSIGSYQDITERKQSEDKLRESEERLGLVMEGSQLGYWDWDIETGKVFRNVRWAEMLGYTLEEIELSVKQWSDLHHPDDRESALKSIQDHLDGKTTAHRIEYRMRAKDGSYKWILDQARVVKRDEHGKPLRMSGTHTDITERKLQDLRQTDEQNILEMLVRGEGLITILEALVRHIEYQFPNISCSILLLDSDGLHMHHGAGQNIPQSYVDAIDGLQIGPSVGSCGTAAYRKAPVYVADIASDPLWINYRDVALKHGFQACWSMPILATNSTVLGTFAIYSNEPRTPGDIEISLLTAAARLACIAIERKRSEESLRKSEEKYRLLAGELEERVKQRTAEVQDLYENAPSGYHSVDQNGNIVNINQTELQWLGYTRDELMGKHITTIFPVEIVEANLPILIHEGKISDLEFELIRKDRSRFPVLLNAVAVYDVNGKFKTSRGTLTDITRRKQAEQVMHASLRRVNALYHISQGSIDLMNLQSLLKLVSDNMVEVLVADRVNILVMDVPNKKIEMAYKCGPGSNEVIEISFEEAMDGLTGWALREQKTAWSPHELPDERESSEVQKRRKDTNAGDIIVVPLIFQGRPLGTITAINRPEDDGFSPEDLDLIQVIANQVAVAIEHLRAKMNLQHANMELERAMRVKDEFLANMSHELRTPLNGILGMSEILLEGIHGSLSDRQQAMVTTIEESGQHLLSLINDILDLSKIEAEKLDLVIENVSIEDICQTCLSFIKEPARKKDVVVNYQRNLNIPILQADPKRLKQILINLLSNAIKFTPSGGNVTLAVSADEKQNRCNFLVSDTGIGIASGDMHKLFQPFSQIDSSLTRRHEGTGLGLLLVKRLVELHGGVVSITSEVGRGSDFLVSLPWWTVPSSTTKSSPAIPAVLPVNITGEKQGVILVAEDNEANIMIVGDYLLSKEYEVIYARDGREALDKTIAISPDLVLMDLQMPEMDGLEVIRRLRADARYKNLPIIALTALAMEGDRERCLEAGATDYMSKPVSLKKLVETIRALLMKS